MDKKIEPLVTEIKEKQAQLVQAQSKVHESIKALANEVNAIAKEVWDKHFKEWPLLKVEGESIFNESQFIGGMYTDIWEYGPLFLPNIQYGDEHFDVRIVEEKFMASIVNEAFDLVQVPIDLPIPPKAFAAFRKELSERLGVSVSSPFSIYADCSPK